MNILKPKAIAAANLERYYDARKRINDITQARENKDALLKLIDELRKAAEAL